MMLWRILGVDGTKFGIMLGRVGIGVVSILRRFQKEYRADQNFEEHVQ